MKNPFNPKPWERDPIWKRDNWQALNQKAAGLWQNVQAIRQILADVRATAVQKLSLIGPTPGNVDTLQNRIPEIRFRAVPIGSELAAFAALLAAAEESPEFAVAEKQYAPLVKAAEEKERKDEEARVARQRAQADVAIAIEAAKQRAISAADNAPEVLDAKKKLASLTAV
jgi:hypothetical protein